MTDSATKEAVKGFVKVCAAKGITDPKAIAKLLKRASKTPPKIEMSPELVTGFTKRCMARGITDPQQIQMLLKRAACGSTHGSAKRGMNSYEGKPKNTVVKGKAKKKDQVKVSAVPQVTPAHFVAAGALAKCAEAGIPEAVARQIAAQAVDHLVG